MSSLDELGNEVVRRQCRSGDTDSRWGTASAQSKRSVLQAADKGGAMEPFEPLEVPEPQPDNDDDDDVVVVTDDGLD